MIRWNGWLAIFLGVMSVAALKVHAALVKPTGTYALMKCVSSGTNGLVNGTLWASMGHKVSSDKESYFFTELGYFSKDPQALLGSLSWLDSQTPRMALMLNPGFLKIEFVVQNGARTQSHTIVAMADRSDVGSYNGNWARSENGKEVDSRVTCTAR